MFFSNNNICQMKCKMKMYFCSKVKTSNVFSYLNERGLINNISNHDLLQNFELNTLGNKPRVYIGFDPTAISLHLGNLIGILVALRFSAFKIEPIFLLGGATGQIGDPSGKSKERPLIEKQILEKNLEGIKNNLITILKNIHSDCDFKNFINCKRKLINSEHDDLNYILLNNNDFYKDLSVLDFLRQIGTNLRMGPLLSRETVKNRIQSDEGLSLTEFLYQTFQGFDYLKLHEFYNAYIQIGGSDQWGNMLAGYELIKKIKNTEVINMTFPLMTTSSGQKFGKSEGNALYLNPEITPINLIYQYIYNSPDEDMRKLFYSFTFMEKEEIEDLINNHEKNPEKRNAQKLLSQKLITMIFSEEDAKKCANNLKVYYSSNFEDLAKILDECNCIEIKEDIFLDKVNISSLLNEHNLINAKAEFKRLLKSGTVLINNNKIEKDIIITKDILYLDKYIVIKTGKKNSYIFKIIKT